MASEFPQDEVTGKYEGEELDAQRDRRPTPDRIKRLERKHDELRSDLKEVRSDFKRDLKDVRDDVKDVRDDVKVLAGNVSDLHADVAGAVGKIDGQQPMLNEMLSIVKHTAKHASDREFITVTTQLEVDKAQELAKVEVAKEQELAKVEVAKEHKLDTIKARKVRRKAIAKLVGGIFVGAYAAYEFLRRVGVL